MELPRRREVEGDNIRSKVAWKSGIAELECQRQKLELVWTQINEFIMKSHVDSQPHPIRGSTSR
jgi:hypothetical protein